MAVELRRSEGWERVRCILQSVGETLEKEKRVTTMALTLGVTGILVAATAVTVLIAGSDYGDSADAQETDGAFIVEMVPHHELAIDMAQVASLRAEHPQVRRLAHSTMAVQAVEIDELSKIHARLFGQPTSPAENGSLGMEMQQMGMNGDPVMLGSAKPFDKRFIDMMIPHHQGAVRMARVELQNGEDSRLRLLRRRSWSGDRGDEQLAQALVWSRLPAGGVPAADEEAMPDQMMMEH